MRILPIMLNCSLRWSKCAIIRVLFMSLIVVLLMILGAFFFVQSQLKRLKLRKNNWDADTYEFDDVLTEFASQKRVYEAVAKPVVEVGYYWFIYCVHC
jgi:hypothetical protein